MNDSDKPASTDKPATAPPSAETPENEGATADKSGATDYAALLDTHKGKLAVGVAATLGLLIYYNLKKKTLPEEDPEGYARLLKLKDNLRQEQGKKGEARQARSSAARAAGNEASQKAKGAENPSIPPQQPDPQGKDD